MNQPEQQLFKQRLDLLKLIASEYNCKVVDTGKVVNIIHEGNIIHIFTHEHILYSNERVQDYFVRDVKEKLG
jgi:hypothetical protein